MTLIWLKKAWSWVKKNWQWILFPVGLFILVSGAFSISKKYLPSIELDEPIRKALLKMRTADETRNKKMFELEEQHKELLKKASEEQVSELEQLREKPIEDVVSWFNSL